jgi:transcriptional regulator with XRE-family HTH domain
MLAPLLQHIPPTAAPSRLPFCTLRFSIQENAGMMLAIDSFSSTARERMPMGATFADSLKSLRTARGISQQQLATKLFVDRSTIARWESGDRVPDLAIVPRIAESLDVDTATLLNAVQADEAPKIIVVDDERIVLSGAIALLEETIPKAAITGFTRPSDALAYAQSHQVALAFLDIELGRSSGLDLCRELLDCSPRTNVVFLTAYREYSFNAWETGACGFLLKPITGDAVRRQLERLRYPVPGLLAATKATSNKQQSAR